MEEDEMTRTLNIVFLGNPGVGKSTFITSAGSGTFPEKVEAEVKSSILDPEVLSKHKDGFRTYLNLIDTSHQSEQLSVDNKIKQADVICLMFSIDNAESKHDISRSWIPRIKLLDVNVPILLIGNKYDLIKSTSIEDLKSELDNLMGDLDTHIYWGFFSSCKKMFQITEILNCARKAVLFPVGPLLEDRTKLTSKFAAVLIRIFKLIDKDLDDVLDNHEYTRFVTRFFQVNNVGEEFRLILGILQKEAPTNVRDGGITIDGFLFLMLRLISIGQTDSVWTVLRGFGYGDDLELRRNFIEPRIREQIPLDARWELSDAGIDFLTDLFRRVNPSQFGSETLAIDKWEILFSTAPKGIDLWPNKMVSQTQVDESTGHLTLRGWLSLWSMMTLIHYKTTLAYMAYLGFEPSLGNNNLESLQLCTKPNRSVFMCYVFGSKGCGKSSLLCGLINRDLKTLRDLDSTDDPNSVHNKVANQLDPQSRTLVMQEFANDFEHLEEIPWEKGDVLCFLYNVNDPNSFDFVVDIHKSLKKQAKDIPYLFVATKADLPAVEQRHESPVAYCQKLGIDPPIKISIATGNRNDIYNKIIRVAMSQRNKKTGQFWYAPVLSMTIPVLLVLGFLLFKKLPKH